MGPPLNLVQVPLDAFFLLYQHPVANYRKPLKAQLDK